MKIYLSPDRLKALSKISENPEEAVEKAIEYFKNKKAGSEYPSLFSSFGTKIVNIKHDDWLKDFVYGMSVSKMVSLILDIYVKEVLGIKHYSELNINYDYTIYENELLGDN